MIAVRYKNDTKEVTGWRAKDRLDTIGERKDETVAIIEEPTDHYWNVTELKRHWIYDQEDNKIVPDPGIDLSEYSEKTKTEQFIMLRDQSSDIFSGLTRTEIRSLVENRLKVLRTRFMILVSPELQEMMAVKPETSNLRRHRDATIVRMLDLKAKIEKLKLHRAGKAITEIKYNIDSVPLILGAVEQGIDDLEEEIYELEKT